MLEAERECREKQSQADRARWAFPGSRGAKADDRSCGDKKSNSRSRRREGTDSEWDNGNKNHQAYKRNRRNDRNQYHRDDHHNGNQSGNRDGSQRNSVGRTTNGSRFNNRCDNRRSHSSTHSHINGRSDNGRRNKSRNRNNNYIEKQQGDDKCQNDLEKRLIQLVERMEPAMNAQEEEGEVRGKKATMVLKPVPTHPTLTMGYKSLPY